VACPGGTCELFGLFGIFVQGLIGLWCLFTLVVLWRCEANRRSLATWLGDMSKQLVGAGWGHVMNLFLAMFLGAVMEDSPDNNQCVWYLVGFLSDIIVVTFLCWWLTNTLRPHIRHLCGIDIGDYEHVEVGGAEGEPKQHMEATRMPWWVMWLSQTGIWLLIMTSVKFVVTIGVFYSQDVLYTGIAKGFQLMGLCHHQRAQLVTSVIVVPIIGDAFQFAVQDSFLKNTGEKQDSTAIAESGGYLQVGDMAQAPASSKKTTKDKAKEKEAARRTSTPSTLATEDDSGSEDECRTTRCC